MGGNFTSSDPVDMVDSDNRVVAYPWGFDGRGFTVSYGPPPPAIISIVVNPATIDVGQTVTYATSVSGPTEIPTGTVTFTTGSTTLCTATLDEGEGSCSSTNAPIGTDSVTGTYSGDGSLSSSTSYPAKLQVLGPPPPASTNPPATTGYDLVGSDGGVFVFHGGFFGSLPGLGVHVNDITGIVPTSDDNGYFLVGSDGGVFAFHAPFANSLPGIGVHVNDIVGIVPTLNHQGYFLVGRRRRSLQLQRPLRQLAPRHRCPCGRHRGIAATSRRPGLLAGRIGWPVYAFGDAHFYGNAPAGAVGITVTQDGGGYWVVGANGCRVSVREWAEVRRPPWRLGCAVDNIVGIVVSPDSQGYNLFGSDGGVFTFGDAENKVPSRTRSESEQHRGGSTDLSRWAGYPSPSRAPPSPFPVGPACGVRRSGRRAWRCGRSLPCWGLGFGSFTAGFPLSRSTTHRERGAGAKRPDPRPLGPGPGEAARRPAATRTEQEGGTGGLDVLILSDAQRQIRATPASESDHEMNAGTIPPTA